MLIVKRRKGESIIISPSADIPPDMTVSELFASGNIEIRFIDTLRGMPRWVYKLLI